jgi:Integrase core domain
MLPWNPSSGLSKKSAWGSIIYLSHEQARQALFEYLEIYSNRQRRHSTLGYVSPLIYEQAFEAADQNKRLTLNVYSTRIKTLTFY